MNKTILLGRLTKDPDTTTLETGKTVTDFSVAYNKIYYQDGIKKSRENYFNCVAWGEIGENIQKFFKKGYEILMEGELQSTCWEDAKTGKTRTKVEINIKSWSFTAGTNKNTLSDCQEEPQSRLKNTGNGYDHNLDDEPPF